MAFNRDLELKVDLMKIRYFLAFRGLDFLYPLWEKEIIEHYKQNINSYETS